MRKYNIAITPEALIDIQDIINWYNNKQSGLGTRFYKIVIRAINSLNKSPQIYAVRYKQIRCLKTIKFPYMIHFYINDKNNTVEILAVISTDRNPAIWSKKTNK